MGGNGVGTRRRSGESYKGNGKGKGRREKQIALAEKRRIE